MSKRKLQVFTNKAKQAVHGRREKTMQIENTKNEKKKIDRIDGLIRNIWTIYEVEKEKRKKIVD